MNKKLTKVSLRHKILFQNSASAGIVWRDGYVITDWNAQAQKIFGWSSDEAVGKSFFDFLVPKEEQSLVEQNLKKVLSDHEMHVFINKNYTKDGKVVICEWHNTLLPKNGDDVQEIVSLAIDVTQRYLEEERLKKQANHDALTLLPNRYHFEESLQKKHSLAKRENSTFGVAFIDLDGFKAINDNYSHSAGDFLLKTLADRFKKIVRQEDTIARLGGDEFALLLNMHDENEPYQFVLSRILEAASKPVLYHEHELKVSTSVGVSVYSAQNSVSIEELLHQADTSMYEAKKSGKNRYFVCKVS